MSKQFYFLACKNSRGFAIKKSESKKKPLMTFLRKDYRVFMPKSGNFITYFRNVPGVGLANSSTLAKKGGLKAGVTFDTYPARYLKSLLRQAQLSIQNFSQPVDDLVRKSMDATLIRKIRSGELSALRFAKGLPSKGQRTKSNAKTSKKAKPERALMAARKVF